MTIAATVIVLFAVTSCGLAQNAAVVNGFAITDKDLQSALRRSRSDVDDLSEEEQQALRREVLDVLIDETLISQYLDRRAIQVDEATVADHIKAMRRQQEMRGISFASFLSAQGLDETKLKKEVGDLYRWLTFVERQSTDAALREYHAANEAAFDGSLVRASHILAKFDPLTASSEARDRARAKIERLRRQIIAGESFSDVARKHSDCPSKSAGGDLGYFPRKGVMSEPFAVGAFALPTGQMSQTIRTEIGFHLILVTDRKAGQAVAYEEVADNVNSLFAEDLRQAVIARMRSKAVITIPRARLP